MAQAKALLLQPGMLKKLTCNKSAVPIRSACCALVALLCRRHAQHPPPCRLLNVLTKRSMLLKLESWVTPTWKITNTAQCSYMWCSVW